MRLRGALLIWAVSARLVIAGGPPGRGEDLLATGPRPLSAAVRMFQERCHCVVTYEDPKWPADQIEQLPGPFAATLIPAGRAFMFLVPHDIASQPCADITGALQQMLDACERTNDGGPFRSVAGSNAWHIVPRSGS